ncbi:hypothetical protein N7462_003288 [Penicillium macrosclerotiorum]|uniref:uncharacterized protein n=1 Tax=Penicillium macrosclerotiorum TaxID=303699 RepID=UPI002549A1D2|nr:uncharacterized protein N7462_003288 [Penicillium macrosclerotiorum]KAJ5688896.1 hypothetical protein N7462_003288 [Penicillium macrosclerotiorum]
MKDSESLDTRAPDTDILEALDEAFKCTKCQIAVTQSSMKADIDKGAYNTNCYPPFFRCHHTRDDNISPLDTQSQCEELSFWKRISPAQRECYYSRVEQTLNTLIEENKDIDPEVAVLFAHYQVDFHIRQHHLARRGVLALCRNADDMQQLRHWQWKMNDLDSMRPVNLEKTWPDSCRHAGWPGDQSLEMLHQTLMWKRASPARRKRLEEVRARWAIIMAERRRQREMLQLKQGLTITVRVYCRGELWNVRELPWGANSEPSLRPERIARSIGF